MRPRRLLTDRRASGYIESIFAIMVISSSITILLASFYMADAVSDGEEFLEEETALWKQRILSLLSVDGTTIEKKDLHRLVNVDWELGEERGVRAEIRVMGSERYRLPLLELGMPAEFGDECYCVMVPINFIDDGSEVMAAKLVVATW